MYDAADAERSLMNRIHAMSAVILSAGFSERMGCFKPLMTLGGQRVVDRVVSLYRSAGISDICVVVGHQAAEMKAALAGSGARIVLNENYQSGMYSSVREGIRRMPPRYRAFFIHPVDIPLVRLATVRTLLMTFHQETGKIYYPVFDARRGHPPLIAADLKSEITAYSGAGGLRTLLRRHDAQAVDVPVADESILFDLDTPGDHHFLSIRLKNEDMPTPAECRWMMERIYALPDHIIGHCRAVAAVAKILAWEMHHAGLDIDADLVYSSALVHDIARGKDSHAEAGADLLEAWGFSKVAAVVRTHMDIDVKDNGPITEAEILYLADKLVSRDRMVDLDDRFREKMTRYEKNSQALASIRRRLESARKIRMKLEKTLCRTIDDILGKADGVTQPDTLSGFTIS